jgi:hypothetical protein
VRLLPRKESRIQPRKTMNDDNRWTGAWSSRATSDRIEMLIGRTIMKTWEAKSRIGGAPWTVGCGCGRKYEQKENGLDVHRHGENPRIESSSCAGELPTAGFLGL